MGEDHDGRMDRVTAERVANGDLDAAPALADLLAAARAPGHACELRGEARAVQAFRLARLGQGAAGERGRPRRLGVPEIRRVGRLSLVAAAACVVVAGVAVAAGTGVLLTPLSGDRTLATQRPDRPDRARSATPGASSRAVVATPLAPTPTTSARLVELCQFYLAAPSGHAPPKSHSPAFATLANAAGGADRVNDLCARLVPTPLGSTPGDTDDKTHKPHPARTKTTGVPTAPPTTPNMSASM